MSTLVHYPVKSSYNVPNTKYFQKTPVKMLKQSSLCKLLINCTLNGTRHSNKNVKVIQYVTKNS